MPGREELEERAGAGLEIAGGVVGPFIGMAEHMGVQLLESRPLEAEPARPGQAA